MAECRRAGSRSRRARRRRAAGGGFAARSRHAAGHRLRRQARLCEGARRRARRCRAGRRGGRRARPLVRVRAPVWAAAWCGRRRGGDRGRLHRDARRSMTDYVRDGAEIYRRSFATIRAEADLAGLPPDVERVAVRMIHACGMVDLPTDLAFSPDVVAKARAALDRGAPVLCDATMIASGVTRRRLPADNDVLCTLADPRVPALAERLATTRSAAALELWGDRLADAVVAIGNAPTALFRLLELLDEGAPRPAAGLGLPV